VWAGGASAAVGVGNVAQIGGLGVGLCGTHGHAQPSEGEDESGKESLEHLDLSS
jgi:hypothetical protein